MEEDQGGKKEIKRWGRRKWSKKRRKSRKMNKILNDSI